LEKNTLSLADLVLFVHISPVVKNWSEDELNSNDNISRWYDNIQHLKKLRETIYDTGLYVPIKKNCLVKLPEPQSSSKPSPSINLPASQELSPAVKQPSPREKKPSAKTSDVSGKGHSAEPTANEASVKEDPKLKREKQKNENPKKENVKKEKVEAKGKGGAAPAKDNEPVGFAKLDFRVGRIVNVVKHPNADSLYLEKIDIGEPQPRNVVSGLVKFVPIEEMQNRLVIVMCNLKPSNMRGESSQAMVICASDNDHLIVEPILPPEGSQPGDRVVVDGEEGSIAESISLANKNNIFHTILQPDLNTNDDCIATYKGKPLHTDKGLLRSPTLKNAKLS